MSVIIVREMVGTSPKSWSDAARQAVATAARTVRNIKTIEVVKSTRRRRGRRDRRVPRRSQDRIRVRRLSRTQAADLSTGNPPLRNRGVSRAPQDAEHAQPRICARRRDAARYRRSARRRRIGSTSQTCPARPSGPTKPSAQVPRAGRRRPRLVVEGVRPAARRHGDRRGQARRNGRVPGPDQQGPGAPAARRDACPRPPPRVAVDQDPSSGRALGRRGRLRQDHAAGGLHPPDPGPDALVPARSWGSRLGWLHRLSRGGGPGPRA